VIILEGVAQMHLARKYFVCVLWLFLPTFTPAQVASRGNQNTNVGTNNGLVVQVNVGTSKEMEDLRKEIRAVSGDHGDWKATLIPGSRAIADLPRCVPSPHSLRVRFGRGEGGSMAVCDKQECTALATPDTPLVQIFRRGKAMSIETRVFGQDGRILAEISNNKLYVNSNTAFRWSRPDPHTIEVVDQQDNVALSVEFANPDTVVVEGVFYDRAGHSLTILSNEMQGENGLTASSVCLVNAGNAGIMFGERANPLPGK
jgi:outer membrane protein assembly factor BamB